MRAKLKAVKTELILLGLAAVFLGALWGVSVRDRAMPEPVAVSTEKDLPPEEIQVVLVDLNTAGVDELTTLPGIGESLAKRIVDYRTEHGPFTCVEELGNVSGIGEKKLEALLPEVTVGEGKTEEETAGETPAEDGKESPHADLSGG